jgi:haloalkane dehalogenase
VDVLRTPDERFDGLDGYRFAPRYLDVDGLRIHYLDEGPRDAPLALMLHGEPTWAYLYRRMIPVVVAAGFRAVAPDLIGFGRSDKPTRREDYSYALHAGVVRRLLAALDLVEVTLFCQDWGGLIGLRLLGEDPSRFARVMASNTFLPTGDQPATDGFLRWREYSQTAPVFRPGRIVKGGCRREVSEAVIAAYDAPFPDERYLAGARVFPLLVPITPDDPESEANRAAWAGLRRFEKPFLTAFGDTDPVTAGGDRYFQKYVPGARDQPHVTLAETGHFSQEDSGEELAHRLVAFMRA